MFSALLRRCHVASRVGAEYFCPPPQASPRGEYEWSSVFSAPSGVILPPASSLLPPSSSCFKCVAFHCNALQCIATRCNALQCVTTHCNAFHGGVRGRRRQEGGWRRRRRDDPPRGVSLWRLGEPQVAPISLRCNAMQSDCNAMLLQCNAIAMQCIPKPKTLNHTNFYPNP